ncbi:hypothetical protein NDN08_005507 [Rhodosorus marinus]|uniref:Uncharacterized protein n=1 Tax=Rhodosorus marinus TaxID=101924 RepID=A0AAV8V3X9_9RHOD|nr:hypothetical protein NDN08_005507 [Rhodosorus marinus]
MDEYLKKNYGDASAKGREKKKKRKKKREGNLQVLDDEDVVRVGIWKDGDHNGEDLPAVVVEVPEETRRERAASKRSFAGSWVQNDELRVKSDPGDSHPKRLPSEEDVLAQRRRREEDASPRRRPREEVASPPRRRPREDDASPPRRGGRDEDGSPPRSGPRMEDASPRRRRRREEDGDENISPPRRGGPVEDASPPLRGPQGEDASPPRRRRREKDGQEDVSPPTRGGPDEDASPPRRRPREEDTSPPRRKRLEEDASPPRRRRPDEDAPPRRRRPREEDASPPRRRRREEAASAPRRRRPEDGASPPRGPKDTSKRAEAKMMSSGLSAGLVKGEDLTKQSRALKEERERMLATALADDIGRGAKTVYRDHTGKKIDKADGSLGKSAPSRDEGRRVLIDGEERILGEGGLEGVQESDPIIVPASELSSKNSSLAAAAGGNQRSGSGSLPTWGVATVPESERLRWGDPMANLVKTASSGSSRSKFAAPPNRFNIAPGPRWDGRDRSNGFENKLINAEGSRIEKEQMSYQWSVENM